MSAERIPVWDPLVRVIHWGLVAAFVTAYLSGAGDYQLHVAAGYAALGLVAARVLWGLVGSRHARFADFVAGPRRTLAYLRDLAHRRAPRCRGHNPAGGWMVLALLAVLLVIGLSGIALDAAENRAGPLGQTRLFLYGDRIAATHRLATNLALVLIGLHLAGVAAMSLAHRENLVGAMLTGRKRP